MSGVLEDERPLARVEKTDPGPARAGLPERHLSVVSHEHDWSLREVEYDDARITVNRFECECGEVAYR